MDWQHAILHTLAQRPSWGYAAAGPPASEPTALAALALLRGGHAERAQAGLQWLAEVQASNGAVGPDAATPTPTWPTAWAVLAWHTYGQLGGDARFAISLERGLQWLVNNRSHTQPRPEPQSHDTTLVGWPWADGTHAWIEPTAMHVLALKAVGHADHARTREGVRLLIDRQLPGGGCNYGNTFVLGNKLLPHVQPTGLALWALAGEASDPRIPPSLAYLQREWRGTRGTSSRCYAALALDAHGHWSAEDAEEFAALVVGGRPPSEESDYILALQSLVGSRLGSDQTAGALAHARS